MKRTYHLTIYPIILFLPLLLVGLLYPSITKARSDMGTHTVQAVSLLGSNPIISDDFNTCEINSFWNFTSPLGDSTHEMVDTFTTDASLSIMVPGGAKHSISSSNTNAPRMMQTIDNTNFEVEAKYKSALSQQYQIQGILVEGSGTNEFIRFDLFSDGTNIHVYAATLFNGSLTVKNDITITAALPGHSYFLRVDRQGNSWTQSYKTSASNWTDLPAFTYATTVNGVGVYAGNSSPTAGNEPAHTALVDYFFEINPRPKSEDGGKNRLTVNPVGDGDVDISPNKSDYACNEAVNLAATPDLGWSFAGWSGDLVSNNPDEIINMTGSRLITATFTEDGYTLTTLTDGDGDINRSPEQATYSYGEEVTLEAVPDPGWSFANWDGAFGSQNPLTITMTGDVTITATFLQNAYQLTINGANGSVTRSPDQATYSFGQMVTLTAVPAPTWSFANWSGDLSGGDNPIILTVTGNHTVTANFIQYKLYLPVIVGN